MWNIFEAGHGKAEHDGVGACMKRALCKEQLKFEKNLNLKLHIRLWNGVTNIYT